MKKIPKLLILANLVVLLVYFGFTVFQKEEILKNGKLLLLELAPVDPRSLIQGDYMELRYAITDRQSDLLPDIDELENKGYCVVEINEEGVATLKRFQPGMTPVADNEYLIAYHKSAHRIRLGAESYFFEEGSAKKFENARYGGLRVDPGGNSLLIGLFDENKKQILP